MEPKIIQNGNFIEVIGHYDDEVLCSKMTLLAELYAVEHRDGYAKFPLNVADKLNLVDDKLEFPPPEFFALNVSLVHFPSGVSQIQVASDFGVGWYTEDGTRTINFVSAFNNIELWCEEGTVIPDFTLMGQTFTQSQATYNRDSASYVYILLSVYVTSTDTPVIEFNAPQPTGYSIIYHANGGTPEPENLTEQTNLPSPLPTISKDGYTFDDWYLDSTFQTPAIAGAEISADTDLYAKFTRSHIALDLSTLSLPEGIHSIQMQLSDDGVTKADSELSNAVEYTVAPSYQYTQDGSVVTLINAPYSQIGSEVTIL